MALPVTIPNTFANATASIPLSQLDTNFTTLANAVNGISDGSESLANVSVTGGTISNVAVSATTLNTSGQVVFNDAGADVDFRVEGDTDANLLFVDASADAVGIGTTPSYKFHVVGGQTRLDVSSAGTSLVCLGTGSNFQVDHSTSGYATLINSANTGAAMIFKGSQESMRIDSSGRLLVGTTSVLDPGNVQGVTNLLNPNNDGKWALAVQNNGTSATYGRGIGIRFATDYNNDSNEALFFIGNATSRFIVSSNGNVKNSNDVYGQISSDERLKQDIVDAASQWDDLKAIRIRKFHYRNDPDGQLQIGCIAQEAEQVSPGLVNRRPVTKEDVLVNPELGTLVDDLEKPITDEEGNITGYEQKVETDTEVLSFKSSILFWKATKALQEAMERIETLEAKVAALENA